MTRPGSPFVTSPRQRRRSSSSRRGGSRSPRPTLSCSKRTSARLLSCCACHLEPVEVFFYAIFKLPHGGGPFDPLVNVHECYSVPVSFRPNPTPRQVARQTISTARLCHWVARRAFP